MENKEHKKMGNNLEMFSDVFHEQLDIERKTSFGEIMVVIDTLGLPETQHNAIKQLIARKLDDRTFRIMEVFDKMVNGHFDYDRNKEDAVEVLA